MPDGDFSGRFPTEEPKHDIGVVGVLWYDRREANDNLANHARFAASFDGGLTFSPSVRMSAAPNDPKAQRGGEPFSVHLSLPLYAGSSSGSALHPLIERVHPKLEVQSESEVQDLVPRLFLEREGLGHQ